MYERSFKKLKQKSVLKIELYYCTCAEDTKYFRDGGELRRAKVVVFSYQFIDYVLKIYKWSGLL